MPKQTASKDGSEVNHKLSTKERHMITAILIVFTAIAVYDFSLGLYDRWIKVNDLVDAKYETQMQNTLEALENAAKQLIDEVETELTDFDQMYVVEPVKPVIEYKDRLIQLDHLLDEQMPVLWSIAKKLLIDVKGLKKPELVQLIKVNVQ